DRSGGATRLADSPQSRSLAGKSRNARPHEGSGSNEKELHFPRVARVEGPPRFHAGDNASHARTDSRNAYGKAAAPARTESSKRKAAGPNDRKHPRSVEARGGYCRVRNAKGRYRGTDAWCRD